MCSSICMGLIFENKKNIIIGLLQEEDYMTKDKAKKTILVGAAILLFIVIGLKIYYNKVTVPSNNTNINQPTLNDGNKLNITEKENIDKQSISKGKVEVDDGSNKMTSDKKDQIEEIGNTSSKKDDTQKLTAKQAEKIISKHIGGDSLKIQCTYDHNDKKDGIDYYVIHAYENMEDHVATIGWYYVNVNTGESFEWDLINDKLIPLK